MMKRFNASQFFSIAGDLARMSSSIDKTLLDGSITKDSATEMLAALRERCDEVGLSFSVKLINRLETSLKHDGSIPTRAFVRFIADLTMRMEDEMSCVIFLGVDPSLARFYDQPNLFGDDVDRSFPSISAEVREAGTCLSVGRYTACVFHLMRVVEVALHALAKDMGVTKESPSWQGWINKIRNALDELESQKKDAAARKRQRFLSEACLYISNVKDGWRNPHVHTIASFVDADGALKVFESVRHFMQHIATHLHE